MDKEQIKKTWMRLLVPLILGFIILLTGIIWNRLGSKRPDPQTYSFFLSLLGAVLAITAGLKVVKFKKYLKDNNF